MSESKHRMTSSEAKDLCDAIDDAVQVCLAAWARSQGTSPDMVGAATVFRDELPQLLIFARGEAKRDYHAVLQAAEALLARPTPAAVFELVDRVWPIRYEPTDDALIDTIRIPNPKSKRRVERRVAELEDRIRDAEYEITALRKARTDAENERHQLEKRLAGMRSRLARFPTMTTPSGEQRCLVSA